MSGQTGRARGREDHYDPYTNAVSGPREQQALSSDGGYENRMAHNIIPAYSGRYAQLELSTSPRHSSHTYRSLQSGLQKPLQDQALQPMKKGRAPDSKPKASRYPRQDRAFDQIPSTTADEDGCDYSMPPEDDVYLELDHIPEPMRKQNSKPISTPVPELTPKENLQPTRGSVSKPIPKEDPQTSPQPVTKGSTCKLVIGAVVMIAVLAVGIGVGVAVGVLIIAKDGCQVDLKPQKEVNVSLVLTVTSHVYTPEIADPTTQDYQLFLQNFCSQVHKVMESSSEVEEFVSCTISSLGRGSVLVEFTVVVIPKASGFTPDSIVAIFVGTQGNMGNGWTFDDSKISVVDNTAKPVPSTTSPATANSTASGSTPQLKTTTLENTTTTAKTTTTTSAPTSTTSAPTTTEQITNTTTPTVAERCQNDSTALFPHPTLCQVYYNCSNRGDPQYSSFERYMEECFHPQLFDADTLQCKNYSEVDCGQREEVVEYCSYRRNYRYYKDTPCYVNHPSCKGLSDGRNVYQHRNWSPYYAECKDQRLVGTGYCPINQTLGMTERFSPDLLRCASLYEIPEEHGGYFLNCTGRADLLYADDVTHRPQLYFRCEDGQLTSLDFCPNGYFFRSGWSQCQPR